jgi:uncharacterized membrane protein
VERVWTRFRKEIVVPSVPLHPALVHIPLGLAFIMPALVAGFTWAMWTGRVRPRAWLVVVVLLAILLGAGLVALNTGQNEEERVERVVPEAAISAHEAYAEQFLWVTGATLAVSALVLLLRGPGAIRALSAATVLGAVLITAFAVRVGHAGGELVYIHNAASAYGAANKQDAKVLKQQVAGASERAGADGDDDNQ